MRVTSSPHRPTPTISHCHWQNYLRNVCKTTSEELDQRIITLSIVYPSSRHLVLLFSSLALHHLTANVVSDFSFTRPREKNSDLLRKHINDSASWISTSCFDCIGQRCLKLMLPRLSTDGERAWNVDLKQRNDKIQLGAISYLLTEAETIHNTLNCMVFRLVLLLRLCGVCLF